MRSSKLPETKVVMLGRTAVGKSAMVVRYLTRRFIWEYDPTLESSYHHHTSVDGDNILLEILDTAGQNNSFHLEGQVRWGDGFLVMYSITDRESFEYVREIKRALDEIRTSRNVSCVIVGNKVDLTHLRRVTTEEGETLAGELGCAFFETSACDGGNYIDEAFHELHREVRRRRDRDSKIPRRKSSARQVKQALNKVFTKIQNGYENHGLGH